MAYIGKDLNNLGDVQTLDNITFNAGAGPYNLQNGGVQVTNADTASIMISIDGVVQGGNYTVNGSAGTITFDFSVSSGSVCNFVKLFGTGVQLTPKDNSVTSAKIADGTIVNADINNSAAIAITKLASSSITINGSGVSLGGSVTVGETKPTVANVSQTIAPATATTINITGTNFVSIPQVDFINASTGAVTRANTVSFTSATSLSVNCTIATGNYYVRIENPDGNAGRSTNNIITASVAPTWTTNSGSLGSFAGNFSGTLATVAGTSDSTVAFSETTSVLTGAGVTLNTSTGALTTTDFGASSTTPTTYNFTLRLTDAESQTADRAFSMTSTFGASGGGQFN